MGFIVAVCVIIISILALCLRACGKQLDGLARQLEEMPPGSSQRLTLEFRLRGFRRLCQAVNNRLDAQQSAAMEAVKAREELQYTMSCVSHDIRTPLTGAAGYIQLLKRTDDPGKKERYCEVIGSRLKDVEEMLDELFLYTRLCSGQIDILCGPVQVYPALCDSLAVFYEKFEAQGRRPIVDFEDEAMTALAGAPQLRRIFRNLTGNALAHGCGDLYIVQRGHEISFENALEKPSKIDLEHLFDRFYRGDPARSTAHAGLGLAIASQLAQGMREQLTASLLENRLKITLTLLEAPEKNL